MEFTMNGVYYSIAEVEEEYMKDGEDEDHYYYGQTDWEKHLVMLDKKLGLSKKKKTLYHELMHVYIKEYITTETLEDINEEILCDFSANSHDIIHKIVEDYFKIDNKERM